MSNRLLGGIRNVVHELRQFGESNMHIRKIIRCLWIYAKRSKYSFFIIIFCQWRLIKASIC